MGRVFKKLKDYFTLSFVFKKQGVVFFVVLLRYFIYMRLDQSK